MSAQTADGNVEKLPAVPDGWTRAGPGRPLIERDDGEKVRLQWCPICGPGVRFDLHTTSSTGHKIESHIEQHRPEQFGLSKAYEGDSGVDEYPSRISNCCLSGIDAGGYCRNCGRWTGDSQQLQAQFGWLFEWVGRDAADRTRQSTLSDYLDGEVA